MEQLLPWRDAADGQSDLRPFYDARHARLSANQADAAGSVNSYLATALAYLVVKSGLRAGEVLADAYDAVLYDLTFGTACSSRSEEVAQLIECGFRDDPRYVGLAAKLLAGVFHGPCVLDLPDLFEEEAVSGLGPLMTMSRLGSEGAFDLWRLPIDASQLFGAAELLNSLFGHELRATWELRRRAGVGFVLCADRGYLQAVQLILPEWLRSFDCALPAETCCSYAQIFAALWERRYDCVKVKAHFLLLRWFGWEVLDEGLLVGADAAEVARVLQKLVGGGGFEVEDFFGTYAAETGRALLALLANRGTERRLLPSGLSAISFALRLAEFSGQFPLLRNQFLLAEHRLQMGAADAIVPAGTAVEQLYALIVWPQLPGDVAGRLLLAANLPQMPDAYARLPAQPPRAFFENRPAIQTWEAKLSARPDSGASPGSLENFMLRFCFLAELSHCGAPATQLAELHSAVSDARLLLAQPDFHFVVPYSLRGGQFRGEVLPRPARKRAAWAEFYSILLAKRILKFRTVQTKDPAADSLTAADFLLVCEERELRN